MHKNTLISSFRIARLQFQHTYTFGSFLFYEHPVIGYLKKGSAQFLYQGKKFYAWKGDLIYIAKGTTYYSIWSGSPEIEFYSIEYSFFSPYSYFDYRFQIVKNYPATLPDQIYESYQSNLYLSVSALYRMLSDLYARMEETAAYPAVQPAIDYLEEHFAEPVTIDELSRLCHCSSSGFFKLFKTATGVTPITYKHNIMIQHALDLLAHTDLTIEEISAKTGFCSSNYFRRIFFNITQKNPKEVRKNQ